jgi:hypothetical protein
MINKPRRWVIDASRCSVLRGEMSWMESALRFLPDYQLHYKDSQLALLIRDNHGHPASTFEQD